MKSEQFHDLNLKQAETILETVGQLMKLAEKLFCTIRTALNNVSMDQEFAGRIKRAFGARKLPADPRRTE